MNKDSLEKWALTSEIINGLAVIATLLILIFQVQGNTRTLQASTYDSIVADLAAARIENSRDSNSIEARFLREHQGLGALSQTQVYLLAEQEIALFQLYERAFIQWENGDLDDAEWERFRRVICSAKEDPMFDMHVAPELDQVTTSSFIQYRKTQCDG